MKHVVSALDRLSHTLMSVGMGALLLGLMGIAVGTLASRGVLATTGMALAALGTLTTLLAASWMLRRD